MWRNTGGDEFDNSAKDHMNPTDSPGSRSSHRRNTADERPRKHREIPGRPIPAPRPPAPVLQVTPVRRRNNRDTESRPLKRKKATPSFSANGDRAFLPGTANAANQVYQVLAAFPDSPVDIRLRMVRRGGPDQAGASVRRSAVLCQWHERKQASGFTVRTGKPAGGASRRLRCRRRAVRRHNHVAGSRMP